MTSTVASLFLQLSVVLWNIYLVQPSLQENHLLFHYNELPFFTEGHNYPYLESSLTVSISIIFPLSLKSLIYFLCLWFIEAFHYVSNLIFNSIYSSPNWLPFSPFSPIMNLFCLLVFFFFSLTKQIRLWFNHLIFHFWLI